MNVLNTLVLNNLCLDLLTFMETFRPQNLNIYEQLYVESNVVQHTKLSRLEHREKHKFRTFAREKPYFLIHSLLGGLLGWKWCLPASRSSLNPPGPREKNKNPRFRTRSFTENIRKMFDVLMKFFCGPYMGGGNLFTVYRSLI